MDTQGGKSDRARRTRGILLISGALCIALPLVARQRLNERVSVELAAHASESLGLPIELGQASVGLTGTLEIRDVRVGGFFRAKRVIASVAPSATKSRGLAANEILIDSPSLDLQVHRDGSTNLDELARRRRAHAEDTRTVPRKSSRRLRTVRFVNGTLDLQVADAGGVRSEGINLWMRDDKVHALFGRTDVDLHDGAFRATGMVPRAALDYRRGQGLHRLLADGGAISVRGPRGRALVQELMVSAGIGGDGYQLSARTGIDRPTGSIKIEATPTLEGFSVQGTLADTPLALLAPWLPSSMDPRKSRASGHLALQGTMARHTPIDVSLREVHLTGLRLTEPALSRRELHFDLALDMSAKYRPTEWGHMVEAEVNSLKTGALALSGEASGQWGTGRRIPDLAHIAMKLANVHCDAALNSLPAGLRPSLAGLELRGSIGSHLVLDLARSGGADTHLEVESGIEGCRVAAEPPVANTRTLDGDYEYRTPDGRTRVLAKSNPRFVSYSSLPSYVPKTFVAAEDARFFKHDGFDTHQIERSLAIDMQNGKLLRGGSTISQQLVKNLFLHRRRSLARKLQEAILTWRLEQNLDKKRILEIYLNIIELGDQHTYGIAEASKRWFGVEPGDLSVHQTAFLAALTPEPTSMSARIRQAGELDTVSAGRVATILRVMRRAKVISGSEYRNARSDSLDLRIPGAEPRTASND